MAALARLLAGAPRHPTLAAMRSVKVSYLNVAIEAGHSRTLIGHDGCAYQGVRERVKAAMKRSAAPECGTLAIPGGRARPTSAFMIERLRAEKRALANERDILASQLIQAKLIIAEHEKRWKRASANAGDGHRAEGQPPVRRKVPHPRHRDFANGPLCLTSSLML